MCKRKLHILFLVSLLFLLCSVHTTCSAEKMYQVSETQLTQLEMIFNRLDNNLTISDKELLTLREQVKTLNSQLAELRKSTEIAESKLELANQSLAILETEIKAERRQAEIDKYKYGIYGIVLGLAIGGMK